MKALSPRSRSSSVVWRTGGLALRGDLGFYDTGVRGRFAHIGDTPLRLDVTNFSLAAQRFSARTLEGNRFEDHGYGFFINRLNVTLIWGKWTAGTRLDSSVYWLRPDRAISDATVLRDLEVDGTSRFRDSIYPAKVFVTYASPGVELTLGDAYVQFGRGLVLSMRKIDDFRRSTRPFVV